MSAPAATPSADRAAGRDEVRAFFRSALARPPRRPFALTVPAPAGRPLSLLERTLRTHAFHVQHESFSLTTLGATRLDRLHGASRFADAAAAFESARCALETRSLDSTLRLAPVWTFGFAFATGSTDL